jgi:AraC-like DNA-binding protein
MESFPKIYLYRQIVQAKLYIDKNFAQNLQLNKLATEASFSKFHFLRIFKNIYRKTPHQYLITVRIENAMQLLRSGYSVSAACFSVGFESPATFSTLFKKLVGKTPSAFLLQQQRIREQLLKAPLIFVPGCFAEKNGWSENSNFEESR